MKFRWSSDVKEVLSNLSEYGEAVQSAVNKEIAKTALMTEAEAKKRIERAPAGGRTYVRTSKTGSKVVHKASAPGEYPKSDTGNLVASIRAITDTTNNGLQSWLVGTPLDYGWYLEFGTVRMAERPWLMPTARFVAKDMNKRVTKAINEALNNVTKL